MSMGPRNGLIYQKGSGITLVGEFDLMIFVQNNMLQDGIPCPNVNVEICYWQLGYADHLESLFFFRIVY